MQSESSNHGINSISSELVRQAEARGVTEAELQAQIETFRKGIRYAYLDRACTVGDGIVRIVEGDFGRLLDTYEKAAKGNRFSKFVPASGAASRMFKFLQTLAGKSQPVTMESMRLDEQKGDSDAKAGLVFFGNLKRFAFYDDLRNVFGDAFDKVEELEDLRPILKILLESDGLNYSQLPKGLIPFHRYSNFSRTPFEEHLAEAVGHLGGGTEPLAIHFTVPEAFQEEVKAHINSVLSRFDETDFSISYSTQKLSTDTIAVTPANEPFLTESGKLLFRPAGHGALLENLQEIDGDIMFIKNIDNVVPDYLKPTTILYKKLIAGFLAELQNQTFDLLRRLEKEATISEVDEALDFLLNRLGVATPKDILSGSVQQKEEFVRLKLNRPIRICGMVKNVGEPGGGPFWVVSENGELSLQIIESSQVDPESVEQIAIFKSSTHFNPVDLVCGIKDYRGEPFDLSRYRDPEAGFISPKSYNGRELKALELPGLWNGAMADWSTIFVETPLITFNPVKTVNDLLRPEHQPAA